MADQKLRLTTAEDAEAAAAADLGTDPSAASARSPSVTIELDDRSFLFPQHKPVSHLKVQVTPDGDIELSVVYEFNASKHDSRLCTLNTEDSRQFSRKLIDGYYQGRTQNVLSDTAKIGIVFNPNGFLVMFQQPGPQLDLFISPSSLLRLTRGLLKLLDKVMPVAAH